MPASPCSADWCCRPRADIEIQANEILHHKLTLNGYLAEFTGQSMEQITQARTVMLACYDCLGAALLD